MKTLRMIPFFLLVLVACGKAPDPSVPSIDGSWTEVHGQAKLQFESGFVFIEMVNSDGTFPAQNRNQPQFSYSQDGLTLHKSQGATTIDCPLTFKTANDVLIACPDRALPAEMTR